MHSRDEGYLQLAKSVAGLLLAEIELGKRVAVYQSNEDEGWGPWTHLNLGISDFMAKKWAYHPQGDHYDDYDGKKYVEEKVFQQSIEQKRRGAHQIGL